MHLMKYEWKKFFSFRIFWILLVCLLFVNGYVQVSGTNDRYYTPESYRAFFSEIEGMSLSETHDYVEELIEEQTDGDLSEFPMMLLYDMLEISEDCANYPDYLESISEQAENMTAVSIWGSADSFSYRNIQKTPAAYEALEGTTIGLAPSLGLEDKFDAPLRDWLAIFLVFLVVCAVMLRDREQGIMPLLYATPGGRSRLFLSKIGVIALCAIGMALLFSGENLLIGAKLYGLGDLSRPIQSVFGLYSCNLAVSVGQYLVLFFLLKMLAYLLFGMVFALICAASKNNLMVYGISAGFCGVFFLLYSCISEISVFGVFHFLNPVQFTQVNEVLGTYRNINLFGYPFSLKISVLVTISIVLVGAFIAAILIFEKSRNLQYRTISLKRYRKKKIRTLGQFYYVCYRSLVLLKGDVLVLAVLVAAGSMSMSFTRSYNNDDIYYENFTSTYTGTVTQEVYDFLTEKNETYAETEAEIAELEASGGSISRLNQLYSVFNDRNAFMRFEARVNAIAAVDQSEIFYDTGYERLFGIQENSVTNSQEDIVMVLFMLLFLALLMSPIAASDRKTDMVKIIYSTKSGRRGYYKNLLYYSSLSGAFVSLLFSIPYIYHILEKYGTQGISAPMQSIYAFAEVGGSLSVGGLIICLLIVRTIGCCLAACCMSLLSSRFRSPLSAYLINLAIFA